MAKSKVETQNPRGIGPGGSSVVDELASLLGVSKNIGTLSPMEQRLLKISAGMLPTVLQQVRIRQDPKNDEWGIGPLDIDAMKKACRLCLAGAIEQDEQLRALRTQLERDVRG